MTTRLDTAALYTGATALAATAAAVTSDALQGPNADAVGGTTLALVAATFALSLAARHRKDA